jgi:hypothetical protein
MYVLEVPNFSYFNLSSTKQEKSNKKNFKEIVGENFPLFIEKNISLHIQKLNGNKKDKCIIRTNHSGWEYCSVVMNAHVRDLGFNPQQPPKLCS